MHICTLVVVSALAVFFPRQAWKPFRGGHWGTKSACNICEGGRVVDAMCRTGLWVHMLAKARDIVRLLTGRLAVLRLGSRE